MVRSRADLLETDDEPTTRSKIRATVERFITDEDEGRRSRPPLLALLGVGDAPEADRRDVRRVADVLRADHRPRHGALLFEDLHWADSGMLDFIDHMLDWSLNVPILIVTLSRPELLDNRPGWGAGRRNFLALDLQPLDDEACASCLSGLVSGLPEPAIRRS
jgi:predicted ATPase